MPEISSALSQLNEVNVSVTLQCNATTESVIPDSDFVWVILNNQDRLESSLCSENLTDDTGTEESGSGMSWSPLDDTKQVSRGFSFTVSAADFPDGAYFVCMISSMDFGICSSNSSIVAGKEYSCLYAMVTIVW